MLSFQGHRHIPENPCHRRPRLVHGNCNMLQIAVFCPQHADNQLRQCLYGLQRLVGILHQLPDLLVPVGIEAFVFFVNEKNPVDSLTVEQVRAIYAGEHKNWSDVGGANRVINPVTRLAGSGSQSAMDAFMGDRKIAPKSPLAIFGASIGFSFRYYMDGIVGNESVKMIALNGVYPSAENIRNGTYPIIAKFYAIYRADNANPNIPVLIDWILSDEGQTLIEKSGYVRIN